MPILNQLYECKQANELQAFLYKKITPDIGRFFGGRRFVLLGESGSLSLNDIVKQFKAIHQNSPKNKDILKIEKDIDEKIYRLDSNANELLNNKNYFVFIITTIKSFIGNLIFDRDQILDSIREEIGSELRSIREKKIQLLYSPIQEKKRQQRERFYLLSISEIVNELYNPNTKEKRKTKLKKYLYEKLLKVSNSNDIEEVKKAFSFLIKNQPNFIDLAKDVEGCCRNLVTNDVCKLFESLQWPTEDLKKQYLPEFLKSSILNYSNNSIRCLTRTVNGSLIIKIIIDPKNIFGCGMGFTTNPINTPPSLAKALAVASISVGEKAFLHIKEKCPQANIPLPIKLEIELATFSECTIPRSMLDPMLPYLLSNPHFSIIFYDKEYLPKAYALR
ncbi:MAG: hypothetical protein WC222_05700 [Parachlamydiales bacterium]|jgi:hypothetical protein